MKKNNNPHLKIALDNKIAAFKQILAGKNDLSDKNILDILADYSITFLQKEKVQAVLSSHQKIVVQEYINKEKKRLKDESLAIAEKINKEHFEQFKEFKAKNHSDALYYASLLDNEFLYLLPDDVIKELATLKAEYHHLKVFGDLQGTSFSNWLNHQNKMNDFCVGYPTWEEFDVERDRFYQIVISIFNDPKKCAPLTLNTAINALRSNAQHSGLVWRFYQVNGFLSYEQLMACISAYRRHTCTNYDNYLKVVLNRDEAIELAKADSEYR